MSASGYKQTLKGPRRYVRFTPNSGHKRVTDFMSAFDPKRTFQPVRINSMMRGAQKGY
jgi:hypothetical protein